MFNPGQPLKYISILHVYLTNQQKQKQFDISLQKPFLFKKTEFIKIITHVTCS